MFCRRRTHHTTRLGPAPLIVRLRLWQTQLLCYIALWAVTGDEPLLGSTLSSGSQASPSQNEADYSILAISVAMYLLLSIAAADLWGGLALVLEGRGSGQFIWLSSRRMFGACLLITFGVLVGASTRVLFYSSFENVDWVLGAAAVLFIADVVSSPRNSNGSWSRQ